MNSKTIIQFGTDGWRAIISDSFTFENVRAVIQAVADYMKSGHYRRETLKGTARRSVARRLVVGYDTRFLSDQYAAQAARVLAGNGYQVFLMDRPAPTPCISHCIRRLRLGGGIIITASHNPASYNGIKVKAAYAGASSPEMTREIERRLFKTQVKQLGLSAASARGKITYMNETARYISFLKRYLDMRTIRKGRRLRILVDSMYGAGGRLIEEILSHTQHKVRTLHAEHNPSFGGTPPEPIGKNLKELMREVKRGRYDLGLATDGDADRIGAVDAQGRFVNSQWIFSHLLLHLVRNRGMSGAVAKSLTTTTLLDHISSAHGLKVYETPVGFKHIVSLMLREDILIGGEESGGLGFKNTVPERDGILSGLLLVELLCTERKTLVDIQKAVVSEFGSYHYDRYDWHFKDPRVRARLSTLMSRPPREVLGKKPVRVQTEDGLKLVFEDESWLLLRPSGTEPTLRIYAEASSARRVQAMLKAGRRLVEH